ncbi:MAG: N-acetyltransferase family protein [Planctomycetota bacterium]
MREPIKNESPRDESPQNESPRNKLSEVTLRPADPADADAIARIYHHSVQHTMVAWTETPQTESSRRDWMRERLDGGFPIWLAEASGCALGFASYGHFRGQGVWPGYSRTVEHCVYLAPDATGAGTGSRLLRQLIDTATAAGLHVMVGAIDGENESSIRFHQRLGFEVTGRMPQVGRKWGTWRDLVWVQRTLGGQAG